MWMWRSWSRMLCLAGGLWAVGCTDYGSYTCVVDVPSR